MIELDEGFDMLTGQEAEDLVTEVEDIIKMIEDGTIEGQVLYF